MDNALSIASKAIFDGYRFSHISAERFGESNEAKGYLTKNLALTVSAGSSGNNRTVAEVHLTYIGVPGERPEPGAPPKTVTPRFKIEVKAEGIARWDETPSDEILASKDCLIALCRPVYAIAAIEIKHLASKLGLTTLKINMDLLQSLNESEQADSNPQSGRIKKPRKTAAKTDNK